MPVNPEPKNHLSDDSPPLAPPVPNPGSAVVARPVLALGPRNSRAPTEVTDESILSRWFMKANLGAQTRRAYELEGRRFRAWLVDATFEGAAAPTLTLPYVTELHVEAYAEWLSSEKSQANELRAHALLASGLRAQPRRGPLHARSKIQALALLNALWSNAQTDPHSAELFPAGNPVERVLDAVRASARSAKDRDGDKRQDSQFDSAIEKYLNPAAWEWVLLAQERLEEEARWRGPRADQARLVMALAYFQALRIHEIRLLDTTDLVPPEQSSGRWRIRITGKGGSRLPATLYEETRSAINFAFPQAFAARRVGERIPLVRPIAPPLGRQTGDSKGRLSLSTLQRVFDHVMSKAASLALEAGELAAAEKLQHATSHWCRHARVSHLLNEGASLRVVQKLARHASSDTTRIYDHSDPADVDDPIEEATRRTLSQISARGAHDKLINKCGGTEK